jgi:phenylacetate-coenzyme A ligase PaaK-like adenylate-forming protein
MSMISISQDAAMPPVNRHAELRQLVRRAARQPFFAARYRGLPLDTDFDFTAVPEMTRADITASAQEAVGIAPRRDAAFLFTSGGSTAAPKIAWIPCQMHLDELLPHWQPLTAGDVLANLAMPGRLWSAHYFYNRVAERAGADVIGLGGIPGQETAQWLGFLLRHRATALACTPSQLAQILRTGHPLLRQLRTAIWFGEACDSSVLELRDQAAPHLGLWGNYGSTETWVIGHNRPGCPADHFHILPYQHVEMAGDSVLVTTLHPRMVSPVIRYRIGDRAVPAECPCGRAGSVLRLLGREGTLIKFAGTLVSPEELVVVATSVPGVRAAQAAVAADGINERLEIRIVADQGISADDVRGRLLDSQIDLRAALRGDEDAFAVRIVNELSASPQTGKTPALVRLEHR